MSLYIFDEKTKVALTQPAATDGLWVEATGTEIEMFSANNVAIQEQEPATFIRAKEALLANNIDVKIPRLRLYRIEQMQFKIRIYNEKTGRWEIANSGDLDVTVVYLTTDTGERLVDEDGQVLVFEEE